MPPAPFPAAAAAAPAHCFTPTLSRPSRLLPSLPSRLQARSLEAMSDKAVPEYAPFASTLALRMAGLLKSELRGHTGSKPFCFWGLGAGAGAGGPAVVHLHPTACTSPAYCLLTSCSLPRLPTAAAAAAALAPPPFPACRRRVPGEGWVVAAGCRPGAVEAGGLSHPGGCWAGAAGLGGWVPVVLDAGRLGHWCWLMGAVGRRSTWSSIWCWPSLWSQECGWFPGLLLCLAAAAGAAL